MNKKVDPDKQRDQSPEDGSDRTAAKQNDGSGGGSDQGTKGTQTYPVVGGSMAKQDKK